MNQYSNLLVQIFNPYVLDSAFFLRITHLFLFRIQYLLLLLLVDVLQKSQLSVNVCQQIIEIQSYINVHVEQ
jgi:hypothetical protein